MAEPPDPEPVVSVIIPAYKRPELLRKAVLSVFEQDLDPNLYELIVVDSSPEADNNSVLEEMRALARCRFRYYRKTPEGPGSSRNHGAKNARGRFFAFMDSDCQASPGWLAAGLTAFGAAKVGIVQGRTAPDANTRTGVFTHYLFIDRESFIYECCNIFYSRLAFEEVGGFIGTDLTPHADQPMGGEDVDLAWRVKRNWSSRFAADALVYHEVIPISPWRWICIKQLCIWPALVKKYPQLRQFFFYGYFYDKPQACLVLGLVGMVLSPLHTALLLLAVPYVVARGSEPTKTMRGALRPVRICVYLLRDLTSLCLLAAGSVSYGCLLL